MMLRPWILDTETALITPECEAPPLACLASRSGSWAQLFHWTEFEQHVTELLERPDVLIVGHTIDYDMAVLGAAAPWLLPLIFQAYRQNRVTCTEKREKLIDIALGRFRGFADDWGKLRKLDYRLESVAWRRLRLKLDKDTWRLRYGELRHLPLQQWPAGAREYPMGDVGATEGVYLLQEADPNAVYLADQFRQTRAAFWIRLMRVWGIHTDAQGVFELVERTEQEYDQVADDLRAAGLLREDRQVKRRATGAVETQKGSRNTKAAQDRIVRAYQSQGKDYPRTDTGLPSLEEQACIDSGDPTLIQYARLTSLGTVLAKDIPALNRGTVVPIHSNFDSLKETGRTSSKEPNIQNLRRLPGIRECFVPRCLTCGRIHTPDDIQRGACLTCGSVLTCFASADYSGAELCAQAQMCLTLLGYSRLAELLNDGKDPHLMVASELLQAPYDYLVQIKDAGAGDDCIAGKSKVSCPCLYCWVDNARQCGKVANFGFPGGLGPDAMIYFALGSYGVRITRDQAVHLKKVWLRTLPEFKDYFSLIDWTVKQGQPIEQLFSKRFRGDLSYTARCNTVFQGLAADMAKDAGFRIAEAEYVPGVNPALFGCRTVNFIHDEFLLEVPEIKGHEAAFALRDLMLDAARDWMPDIKVDCKPQLSRRMSKKAKPVYKEGRLIPWG